MLETEVTKNVIALTSQRNKSEIRISKIETIPKWVNPKFEARNPKTSRSQTNQKPLEIPRDESHSGLSGPSRIFFLAI
jgi:hypothetical protein